MHELQADRGHGRSTGAPSNAPARCWVSSNAPVLRKNITYLLLARVSSKVLPSASPSVEHLHLNPNHHHDAPREHWPLDCHPAEHPTRFLPDHLPARHQQHRAHKSATGAHEDSASHRLPHPLVERGNGPRLLLHPTLGEPPRMSRTNRPRHRDKPLSCHSVRLQ